MTIQRTGNKNKEERPVLAVDLGGTKILAALVLEGKVLARESLATLAAKGSDVVIEQLFRAADTVLKSENRTASQLLAVSVAAAGPIDMKNGVVTASPNLPDWEDVPLRQIVRERYGIETVLINDAKAAAFAEHRFGAGRDSNNMIFLTVSTGIGGGIIIDGRLYFGASGSAGEIGHMTIDANGPKCGCGSYGHLEALASGTAIARDARKRLSAGGKSILPEIVKGNLEAITAKEVSEAARKGDSLSLDVISRAMHYLGVGVANVVNIFNPETVVIGGSLAKMGELLFGTVRRVVAERAFLLPAQAVSIVPAELGDDAGVVGAAAFALDGELRSSF